MGTTREEIREWFERGVAEGATHLIVASDTFSYEDYPVFVKKGVLPLLEAQKHTGNMQCVREVYALHLDMESQLNEPRAFHYEAKPEAPNRRGTPPTASDGPFPSSGLKALDLASDWADVRKVKGGRGS